MAGCTLPDGAEFHLAFLRLKIAKSVARMKRKRNPGRWGKELSIPPKFHVGCFVEDLPGVVPAGLKPLNLAYDGQIPPLRGESPWTPYKTAQSSSEKL
jgi:hypothetical protein